MRIRWSALLLVVAFFAVLGLAALMWRPDIDPVTQPPAFDRADIVHGAQLSAIGDCAICHTAVGGSPYAGGRAVQTPFGVIYATNITPDLTTGIGLWSEAAFVRAMRTGVDRRGRFLYPAFPYNNFTRATGADLHDIYAFLMTRAAVESTTPPNRLPFPLNIRPIMAFWNLLFLRQGLLPYDQTHDAVWNRGAYLAASLGHCGACHSPHNALGAERVDRAYQGGEAEGWDGPALSAGTSPAPLSWSAAQVTAFLRTGLADHHAAAAGPMMPVSHDLSAVDLADVQAIATYIASLAGPDDPARDKSVAEFVAAAQASDDPKLSQTAGAVVFAGACAGCHGAGAPMMLNGRPSLALGSALAAAEPRNAIQVILHGLQPRDGEAGPWMPGFAAGLTDTQVADVLAYLRARFTDRAAWNMQTLPATIAGIRKQPAS